MPRAPIVALLLALASALSASCFPVPVHPSGEPRALDAAALEGEWHVVATNFPMWLDGERKNPLFVYHVLPNDEGVVLLDDAVRFEVDGRPSAFLGVDEQDPGHSAHFTWRGKGALTLFSSDWYVAAIADDGAWAVVYYTATIASPDGVDVISRQPELPADRLAEARAAIARDPLLREKARGLVLAPFTKR
jgi:hypothetical protein